MIRTSYTVPLKPDQEMLLVPIGDIHYDTDECDRERLQRLVTWAVKQTDKGKLVRFLGIGDYLDIGSPSNRRRMRELYDSTQKSLDEIAMMSAQLLFDELRPLRGMFIGLLTGHHTYTFISRKRVGEEWAGKTTDQWLAHQLKSEHLGDGEKMGTVLMRLQFPHRCHLDVLALHGGGGAQTPGGRVMKRIRYAEIAPTAHLVISGHDNAKLAYPRSGMDYDHGMIKRYVIGSGSFQRAYLDGETGYAEEWGLIPADLGVTVVSIQVEERHGKWRIDYHCSV